MAGSEVCGICEQPEELHVGTAHKFSVDGQLIAVTPTQKQPQPKSLIAIPDPALRAILLEKGIITYEELAAKEVEILGRQRVPTTPRVDG